MRTEEPSETSEWRSLTTMSDTALIGIGVVMVQPYLTSTPNNTLALASVIAFAGAIPVLSALLLLGLHENHHERMSKSLTVSLARSAARVAAVVGIAAGIWSISSIAGIAFAGSTALAVLVYSAGYGWLERHRQGAK